MGSVAITESGVGELIRRWRDRLDPASAGVPVTSGRRVPGVRREELAHLAGVSVDYLVRLEQGRATHPTDSVIGALARALQLDRAERDHLYRTAGLLPPGDGFIDDHVSPGVQRILTRLGDLPVAVFAADWHLIRWSPSWAALIGDPQRYRDTCVIWSAWFSPTATWVLYIRPGPRSAPTTWRTRWSPTCGRHLPAIRTILG
jgi:transcriptional regulator with XRE-family HTH domain